MHSLPFLFSGIIFGLTAGLSPGPLLTLVISETLIHNKKEGIKIAVAPLITDLPIVLMTVFILAKLSALNSILGAVSLLGSAFLGYLAYQSITAKGMALNLQQVRARSLKKGVVANFLSPHPYMFWLTVGAPTVLKACRVNIISAVLFVLGFYLCLTGSKIMVALIVEKSKSFLQSHIYLFIVRILGILLVIFAVIFIRDGLKFLGLLP